MGKPTARELYSQLQALDGDERREFWQLAREDVKTPYHAAIAETQKLNAHLDKAHVLAGRIFYEATRRGMQLQHHRKPSRFADRDKRIVELRDTLKPDGSPLHSWEAIRKLIIAENPDWALNERGNQLTRQTCERAYRDAKKVSDERE